MEDVNVRCILWKEIRYESHYLCKEELRVHCAHNAQWSQEWSRLMLSNEQVRYGVADQGDKQAWTTA